MSGAKGVKGDKGANTTWTNTLLITFLIRYNQHAPSWYEQVGHLQLAVV